MLCLMQEWRGGAGVGGGREEDVSEDIMGMIQSKIIIFEES